MTDLSTLAAMLRRAAAELPAADLAEFLGAVEIAKATAWARLVQPSPSRAAAPATEPLLDAAELAPLIGRPAWSCRDMARRGVIPCVRVGRLLKFRPSAVIQALEGGSAAGEHRIAKPVRAEKPRAGKGWCPPGVHLDSADSEVSG